MPLGQIGAGKSKSYPFFFIIFVLNINIFIVGLFIMDNNKIISIVFELLIYSGEPHNLTVFIRIPNLYKSLDISLTARFVFYLS